MGQRGEVETYVERRARARALASFFAAGAGVSTLVLLLPGWDTIHTAGVGATVVAATVGALVIALVADHLGPRLIHAATGTGTLLIGTCQVLAGGGSATSMYAMLYIWVILHAALFFSPRVVVAHLASTVGAHAAALVWLGELAALAPRLVLTVGTQAAAAIVVGTLASRQRQLADTDTLTNLPNRRVADRALTWALAHTRRRRDTRAVLALLDLDGFKGFNDGHGHLAGDRVLAEAATAWSQLVRDGDTLARTGGDEFTLVLVGCGLDEAEQVVRRMVEATPQGLGCSAGIAQWDGQEPATALAQRADAALYAAKGQGPVVVARADQPRAARAGGGDGRDLRAASPPTTRTSAPVSQRGRTARR
jgi:diguanylate cyclase (GGDEF)-like protein